LSIKDYIPETIKSYIKIIKNKKRFKHCKIYTNSIGKNVFLGKQCRINQQVILLNGVSINDFSYVNSNTLIGEGSKIGKFCSIGYNCQIGPYEHPIRFITTSPYLYGKRSILNEGAFWNEFSSNVIIGNDVWVGSNVTILQGVTIGDGAIIAAGAVVTKDVAPYSVVGGVPAKKIKNRFEQKEINYLLELKWWDMSEEQLIKNKHLFTSKENWISNVYY
jgi:acetyltransferase-like isoleucine patch superfamily enzyme